MRAEHENKVRMEWWMERLDGLKMVDFMSLSLLFKECLTRWMTWLARRLNCVVMQECGMGA